MEDHGYWVIMYLRQRCSKGHSFQFWHNPVVRGPSVLSKESQSKTYNSKPLPFLNVSSKVRCVSL